MREITNDELEFVGGASKDGANVVIAAVAAGAIAGGAYGSIIPGGGTVIGAIAGGVSAGIHALIIWNAVN